MLDFILLGVVSESGNLWGFKLNFRFSAIFALFRANPQHYPALYLSVMSRLRHVLRARHRHSTSQFTSVLPPPRHNDVRRTSPRHAMLARPMYGGARRPMARSKALRTAHRSDRSMGKVRSSRRDELRPTLMTTNRDPRRIATASTAMAASAPAATCTSPSDLVLLFFGQTNRSHRSRGKVRFSVATNRIRR